MFTSLSPGALVWESGYQKRKERIKSLLKIQRTDQNTKERIAKDFDLRAATTESGRDNFHEKW